MEKIQTVIFDVDGTLGDTVPLIIAAFRKAVEPLVKRPLSDEEIVGSFGPDEEGSVKAITPDDYKQGTADFIRYYFEMHNMCNEPFEGILQLLTRLKEKGVHLAIATGKGKHTLDYTLKRLDVFHFFEHLENGSPEGSRKIEAIDQIVQLFNVSKETTLYVGDSPADVKESRKAGVKPVAAAWASTVKKEELLQEQPDEIFYSVKDFAQWLEERI